MEKRIGCITILVQHREAVGPQVNELISQFGDIVIGRLGLPYHDRGVSIIALIVDTTVEKVSALTGKLGKLPGVQVRSLMTKQPQPGDNYDGNAE